MDNLEHDVKVLNKILNSELFLGKYPMINRVWVYKQHGDKIDIVMNIKEPPDWYSPAKDEIVPSINEYWPLREEIVSFIWSVAKMSGVTSRFNIYP